jgi:hypothetical protein
MRMARSEQRVPDDTKGGVGVRLWHWALGIWFVSVVSATVWSMHWNFPWDPKELPLLQVAGVAFIHALRVTPCLAVVGLTVLWLEHMAPSWRRHVHAPLMLLGSVALGSGIGLWSQQAALAVIGAIAGLTGALLEQVKLSIASPLLWGIILTGCALAIILTW